ncbi:Aste57867_18963 [Aphanomyces stellatus]|uniref:Palmitoyltransferase n=1 Tax=Aphanomyces stellatus TaxID=120398 RepID=A0A485LFP0_9STRA|nr:hypothetical protein As57867_018899 [Aphanomyces stellatus]VFT95693.1 Aste57867_18963 [Aphanomyces stellatus]
MELLGIVLFAFGVPIGLVFLVYFVDPDQYVPLQFICLVSHSFLRLHRDGVLGAAHRLLLQRLPSALSALILKLGGPNVHESTLNAYDYVVYQPNPLLQIVYLHLVIGGYALFLVFGQPLLPNVYLTEAYGYGLGMAAFLALLSFLQACMYSAGVLTKRTTPQYDNYAFDHVMYRPKNECPTFNPGEDSHAPSTAPSATFVFPALTIVRVLLLDRDCLLMQMTTVAWLNSCIGERNYKHFVVFIIVNALFLIYGSFVLYYTLMGEVVGLQLFQSKYINQDTGEPTDATVWIVLRYLIYIHPINCMLFFTCVVMGTALVAFAAFHLWLIGQNRTTNEFFKSAMEHEAHRPSNSRLLLPRVCPPQYIRGLDATVHACDCEKDSVNEPTEM